MAIAFGRQSIVFIDDRKQRVLKFLYYTIHIIHVMYTDKRIFSLIYLIENRFSRDNNIILGSVLLHDRVSYYILYEQRVQTIF